MAGTMSKRRWHNKPRKYYISDIILTLGEVTSVDIMVSPILGLISQITSWLIKNNINML